jgi:diguanylate cyclase (GGDEF)-like protein
METTTRDFRFLFEEFLPSLRLPPDLRSANERALRGGERADIRRQGLVSLEHLVRSGDLERRRLESREGEVGLEYRKGGRGDRVVLRIPAEEWARVEHILGMEPEGLPAGEAPGRMPDAALLAESLESVVDSFRIEDYPTGLYRRTSRLLGLVPRWIPGARARIHPLQEEDVPVAVLENGDPQWVVLDPAAARSTLEEATGPRYLASPPSGLALPAARGEGGGLATAPIMQGESPWGILTIAVPAPPAEPGRLLELAALVARALESILENFRTVASMVERDPLTGVRNRSAYDAQVPLEIERAHRLGQHLALLVADVDRFKEFNDRYGHLVGDRILKEIAATLSGSLRKIDYVFRYGGEEFVLLLPSTSREEAYLTAERLRSNIEEARLPGRAPGAAVRATISIGGAIYPEDASNENDLFDRADQVLLAAKSDGRNRVRFWETPSS